MVTLVEANAQKPAIMLLPAKMEVKHPEALIDTSQTSDTLIRTLDLRKDTSTVGSTPTIQPFIDGKREEQDPFEQDGSGKSPLLGMRAGLIKFFLHVLAIKL
jgi:hypothetical protein